jgi:hypothetical protein
MFKLRQETRRRLCRAAFLLGCLLPILGVSAWGAFRHSPLHLRWQELSLRQSLGLRARVTALTHPRPGVVCYHGLDLADAETGTSIAICGLVEVRRPAIGGPTELLLRDVSVMPGGLAECYALVSRLLRPDQGARDFELLVNAERVTITDAGDPYFLSRASGSIRATGDDCETKLSLAPGGEGPAAESSDASGDKILLRVARNRRQQPITNEWELHTGSHAVPFAWLAAGGYPLPDMPGSRFRGSVGARESDSGWQVAARGTLAGVDVTPLMGPLSGHFFEGTVDLHVDAAKFEAGRLVDLRARVDGGPGRVGRSLLTTAASTLGCTPSYLPQTQGGIVPFEQLACEVAIHRDGKLVIAGRCRDKLGVILSNTDGRPLLAQPPSNRQPQSTLNLVRALAGSDGPLVPATPLAARLLSWLPLANSAGPDPMTATRPGPVAKRSDNAPLLK